MRFADVKKTTGIVGRDPLIILDSIVVWDRQYRFWGKSRSTFRSST